MIQTGTALTLFPRLRSMQLQRAHEWRGSDAVHAKPWTVVGLLALLYAISWVDRMIMALLIDPIQAYTGASDVQMASMFGGGFAIFYVVAGIPVAHMARPRQPRPTNRVWSAALELLTTIAAAVCANLCRIGSYESRLWRSVRRCSRRWLSR